MRNLATLLCGAAAISMGLTAAVPAQAHDWHRGHYWHGYHRNNGAAIALGMIGGALAGAAIASSRPYYYYSYAYPYPPYGYYSYPY